MTRSEEHVELRGFLRGLGYSDSHLESSFPVWTGLVTRRAHVVGFGNPALTDVSTATIVAHDLRVTTGPSSREWVRDLARAIAAPAVVMWSAEDVEIWTLGTDPGEDELVASEATSEAATLASRFHGVLSPARLLAAKSGGTQLALFPVDVRLLTAARSKHATGLTSRIEKSIHPILERIAGKTPREQERELIDASRLVVASLAALVVRDKFNLRADSAEEIFGAAARQFPGYFDLLSDLATNGDDIGRVLSLLGSDVNYRGLDPKTISDVYENAIVTESERLELGIFYTPSGLAKQIAAHIPFEAVDPDDRVTMDPACGSGTLLIAAHNRLESLTPARTDPLDSHRFLRDHLIGFDQDQFAVEIARLALLLNALPAGNSWNIKRRDTPSTNPGSVRRPNLILSNPPWSDIRSLAGTRHQLADEFVAWMLEALRPGGFLGVVLPAGWLSSNTSSESREQLRQHADVFEVWRLPEGTFPSAKQAAAVIFAQKGGPHRGVWAFRRVVQRGFLKRFFESGEADEELLADDSHSLTDEKSYLRGPLDAAATQLLAMDTLSSVADVRSGPVPEPPVNTVGGSGNFLWLRYARDLPAFGSPAKSDLTPVEFPDDFHRAGSHDGSIYRKRKVLVSAKRSPNNPWRLKAGIDYVGLIPRESLYMVTPDESSKMTLHAMLAILSSTVAACWVDQLETKMAINSDVIAQLPIPNTDKWKELDRLGRSIEKAAADAGRKESLGEKLRHLDSVVAEAYELPRTVRSLLIDHFRGANGPEGTVRYPKDQLASVGSPNTELVRRFGAVLGREGSRLRLWVPGVTEEDGEWLPLPKRLPGWIARPGSTFEVTMGPNLDLHHAEYLFQSRLYMDEAALGREEVST